MSVQPTVASPSVRGFTADEGPRLARLAGEAEAGKRGGALRRGLRPVHTCGTFVEGTFEPNGRAGPAAPAHLTTRRPIPVVARFSSCDTRAQPDDRRPGPRGLAVRFHLEGGGSTDLVAMSTDRFPVSDLDGFESASAGMSSRLPLRVLRLFALSLLRQFHSPLRFLLVFSPASYARLDYHAIHTFVWTGGAGRPGSTGQPVRYRWRAGAGSRMTVPWSRLFKGPTYLDRDLGRRVGSGGVRFSLEVQAPVGVRADRLRDVSRPLPRRVPWEPVGELILDCTASPDRQATLDGMLFSPAHLPAGVEPYPGDEIFLARAAAYPASHVYRNGGSP